MKARASVDVRVVTSADLECNPDGTICALVPKLTANDVIAYINITAAPEDTAALNADASLLSQMVASAVAATTAMLNDHIQSRVSDLGGKGTMKVDMGAASPMKN